jgi:hypothetical protein
MATANKRTLPHVRAVDADGGRGNWAARMGTLASGEHPLLCSEAFNEFTRVLHELLQGDAEVEAEVLAGHRGLNACCRVLNELMCSDNERDGDPAFVLGASLVDRCLLAGVVMKVLKCLYVNLDCVFFPSILAQPAPVMCFAFFFIGAVAGFEQALWHRTATWLCGTCLNSSPVA